MSETLALKHCAMFEGQEIRKDDGCTIQTNGETIEPDSNLKIRFQELSDELRSKVADSLAIGDIDMSDYDVVFLAGGWGAAFDFGFSEPLGEKMTEANAAGLVMGGVCHGPLGLLNAKTADGSPLVAGRKISAVTDKQVQELGIDATPHHPERELRVEGALFESETKFRDPFANHWVVDGNLVTGQNQNAGPMVAREMMQIVAAAADAGASPS